MRLLSVCILIIIICSCVTHAADRRSLSKITFTQHFAIHHYADMDSQARVIGQACDGWFDEISKRLRLDAPPRAPIPVYLYRNQQDFSRATGRDKPGEVLGRASTLGIIELDGSGAFKPTELVAGHEIVHVIIFRMLGPHFNKLPLWMHEGAARYLTDDWDIADRMMLADAAVNNTIIPLSELTRKFPTGVKSGLAYAESASAVRYLTRNYRESALAKIIVETRRLKSFNKAMVKTIGITPDQFEENWQKSETSAFLPIWLTKTASIIGATAFIIIGVAAYIAVHRRKNRIIREYEDDDIWDYAIMEDLESLFKEDDEEQ